MATYLPKKLTLKKKLQLPVDDCLSRYDATSGSDGKFTDIREAISQSNVDSIGAPFNGDVKLKDDHTNHVTLSDKGGTQGQNEDFPFLDMSLVDASEMEATCLVSLAGLSLSGYSFDQNPEMVSYVKKVFKLQDQQFTTLYQKVTQKETCELRLMCRVNSGHALELKDSKGSHMINPVCILTILHSRNQRNSIVLHDNVKVWLEKGIVNNIKITSTKQNTASPVWKESIKLPLQNVSEEMLVVEVWSDDRSVKASKKFYEKKAKNFIGRSFYLLHTVPVGGEEKTLTLYSHSGKHQRGQIKLQLNILGLEESTPPDVAHRNHKMLFKVLIDHDSKTNGRYLRKWNVELCREAERLMTEHASLTSLNELRQACVRLSVLIEYHKKYGVNFTMFEELTRKIKENYSVIPVSGDQPVWVKQLHLNLQEIASDSLHVMQDHLTNFNLKSADDLLQIKHIIWMLRTIYTLPEIIQRLSPQYADLKGALVLSIQSAVPRWFFELSRSVIGDGTGSDCSEMELVAIRGLCLHCLHNCTRVRRNLNPIFAEVGIDYYTTFYLELDKLLFGEIISRLELRSKEKDPIMYELYVIFKDMAKSTEDMQLSEKERQGIRVCNYYTWFSSMAVYWIDSALKKGRERIELAIERDQPEVELETQARFSSSAVDASYFIMQMVTFWKNLEWPVAAEAYGYLCTIIERISELALYYVDELYKCLLHDSSIMYDDNGRFRVHEKLCIGLNNMYHVKKALIAMPSSMELDKYYEWLEKEEGIGKKAKDLVEKLMVSNNEDIEHKIYYFLDLIAQKLSDDVQGFFDVLLPTTGRHRSTTAESILPHLTLAAKTVFNISPSKSDEKLTDEEIIEPILDYLTANLQTLGDYLLTPVLHGILRQLWGLIVRTAQDKLALVPRKSSSAEIYRQLEFVLKELKSFFDCDGSGVPIEDLETKACKDVEYRLKLLQTPTKELIDMFYSELVERQASAAKAESTSHGTLDLIVAYLKDKEVVEVAVVQANNLPRVSRHGLADPLVELNLFPEELFSKSTHMQFRTKPQRQTLNPIFSDEFLMPTVSRSLSESSAILLAAVFQNDTNELIGVGVVQCKDIPHLLAHVTSLNSSSSPERKKVSLPLISIAKTPILNELEARWEVGDTEATDFCKSKKRLLQKMDLRKPNFRWLASLNS